MRWFTGFTLAALLAAMCTAAAEVAGGPGIAEIPGIARIAGTVAAAAQEPVPAPPSADEVQVPGKDRAADADRADYAWTLRTLDGEEVSLEEYRGRPLFLNVWATWCAPCVVELASIEALASRPESAGVAFLLVSPEEPDVVDRFRRRHGLSLPVFVEGTRMPDSWGLRALPTTWIVDAEGRVALRHRGAADWDRAEVAALLKALVGEAR